MPEVEVPSNLSVAAPAVPDGSNGASILVIDDEAAIRESLEVLLTLEGYTVGMASDGEQGLRVLELETSTWCFWIWRCRGRAAWSCCRRSRSASPNCRSS